MTRSTRARTLARTSREEPTILRALPRARAPSPAHARREEPPRTRAHSSPRAHSRAIHSARAHSSREEPPGRPGRAAAGP